MNLDDLTGDITELVIAWKGGDEEKGHILFQKVIHLLERAAFRYANAVGQTVGDAVNGAYLIIKRADPDLFESRGSFFALYLKAMDFWLKKEMSLRRAKKRENPLPLLRDPTAGEPRPLMQLLLQLADALHHMESKNVITPEDSSIFLGNKIFGVTQADLADIHHTSRDKIGDTARFVETVLQKEFGSNGSKRK